MKTRLVNYISKFSNLLEAKRELITTLATVAVAITACIGIYQNSSILLQQQREELTRLRAYISFPVAIIEPSGMQSHPHRLRFEVKNDGLTPANNLTMKLYYKDQNQTLEFQVVDAEYSHIMLSPSGQVTLARSATDSILETLRNSTSSKIVAEVVYSDYKNNSYVFETDFLVKHVNGKDFLHIQDQFESDD